MAIVLFAIIGATMHAGAAYWVCFGLYCFFRLVKSIAEVLKDG